MQISRRDVLKSSLVLLFSRYGEPLSWADDVQKADLLADSHFSNGANVYQTADDGPVVTGKLCLGDSDCKPKWNVAQWYSKFDLSRVRAEKLKSGSIRFFDGAKEVVFGKTGSPEADLILSLNARKEYGDKSPVGPHAWPHLYVSQDIDRIVNLSHVSEANLHVEAKLLRSMAHRDEHWDAAMHTAQFQIMLTIANINPDSQGYRDYLWFFVPIYDARYLQPPPMARKDMGNAHKKATDKFMYSPGGAAYTDIPASSCRWIEIQSNLRPFILEALAKAWRVGYLSGSQRIADYGITSVVMGWENTGVFDTSMQVRNLNLAVTSTII